MLFCAVVFFSLLKQLLNKSCLSRSQVAVLASEAFGSDCMKQPAVVWAIKRKTCYRFKSNHVLCTKRAADIFIVSLVIGHSNSELICCFEWALRVAVRERVQMLGRSCQQPPTALH